MVAFWIMTNSVMYSSSTEWQRKAEEVEQQAKTTQESITTYYNTHAHPLTEIGIGSNVTIQLLKPSCGTFMALSQPYHPTESTTTKPPVVMSDFYIAEYHFLYQHHRATYNYTAPQI